MPRPNNNPPCPHCGSQSLRKKGRHSSGTPRYVCGSCGKHTTLAPDKRKKATVLTAKERQQRYKERWGWRGKNGARLKWMRRRKELTRVKREKE